MLHNIKSHRKTVLEKKWCNILIGNKTCLEFSGFVCLVWLVFLSFVCVCVVSDNFNTWCRHSHNVPGSYIHI